MGAPRSDLLVRTLSGVALIVVALGCLVWGGWPFWLLVTAASIAMIVEWAGLVGAAGAGRVVAIAGVAALLGASMPFNAASAILLAALLAAGTVAAAIAGGSLWLGAGVLYVGLPVLALFLVRDQSDGANLTFWTLAIVWATDIGAYFSGRAIGGPKLAPKLSPNKTWAGLIGGMAAALLIGAALAAWLRLPTRLVAIAALLAVAAQCGDLFESWLKRRAGAKDSGRLIPGHGGALDRLDGLVPVVTIIAALIASGWL